MDCNLDPIWEEFSEFRPKSDTKQHPDMSCIHYHGVIMKHIPDAICSPYQLWPSTTPKRDLSKAEEKKFQLDIALAIYTSAITFRVINNPYMRRALTRCCPVMILPTGHALATTFLNMAYTTEKGRLGESLRRQPQLIIGTEGWSNINRGAL
ncbi:hypothetical protein PHMEG_0004252 [Phytophthora megakarya]|uniref:Uncharacterized protein n=1 Tax=Phytophthora megakarya TaxID=4795 RepID=A0A225WVX8_9STRA|nr:hypothetical protein PHMEG_0004252 [Phytophthora megakarya]